MESDVQSGDLIAGKYRVEEVLGRGGMGVVVAAHHEQLGQRVALKFLTDDAYQHEEAVARFMREAQLAVRLQSEHVARVMDIGTLESGAPYMVMEHLTGRDLKLLVQDAALGEQQAADYLLQACAAVAEAHSLGIVHRDLKPSNLFLTQRADGSPLVKVLDFGISKALAEEGPQANMTATSAIMGSPQYMSPEQIRSAKNVDARTDVWALGTILHELVVGAPPYASDTVPGLLAMIVADPAPPPSSVRAGVSPELDAIVAKCLEKDRNQRFADVAELAYALAPLASPEARPLVGRIARILGKESHSSVAFAATASVRDQSKPDLATNGIWSRTGSDEIRNTAPKSSKRGLGLALGGALAGLAALGWVLLSGPSDGSALPPVASPATPPAPLAIPEPKPVKSATSRGAAPAIRVLGQNEGQALAQQEAQGKGDRGSEVSGSAGGRQQAEPKPEPRAEALAKPVSHSRPVRPKPKPKPKPVSHSRPPRPKPKPRPKPQAPAPKPAPPPKPVQREKTDPLDLFNDTK